MSRPPTRRPAFLLTELLAMLVLGTALLVILGKLTVEILYLQRIAAEHADRVAVMDSLSRRLR